jgi:hypothetical protein
MAKPQSTSDGYLREVTARGEAALRQAGWLDPGTGGPDVERIRSMLGLQEIALPEPARLALAESHWSAAAHEALGEMIAALAWYRLGQYGWRGGRLFATAANPPEFEDRDAAAYPQLLAAVCADRVGEAARARELFSWAAANYQLAPDDLAWFAKSRQHQQVWERLPMRAYALACIDEWGAAQEAAAEAESWAAKDCRARGSESYQAPLRILPVVAALARYRLDPAAANHRKLLELLDPGSVASRSLPDNLLGLFLLYNLRQRFSEPAGRSGAALPPAEAARQGAEACVRVMDQLGIHLDGSTEGLKLLDQRAPAIYRDAREEQRRNLVLLWGCYLGEVARAALPGGVWQLDPKNPLGGRLTWDLEEAELTLWAFQMAVRAVIWQGDKGFWETWRETEEVYQRTG